MSEQQPGWDLLGAYAVDAVDDVERRTVERLVAQDPAAAAELAALQSAAADLGGALAADRANRWSGRRPPRATRWLALAAAVVVGAAVPTAVAWQQAQRARSAEQQQQMLADLLRDPSAVVVRSTVDGGGSAVAILADGRASFSATDLPALTDGRVYQLWVVAGEQKIPAGVLGAAAGSVTQETDRFEAGDALAVTVEPAGGSTAPTTAPIVVLSAA